MFDTEGLSCRYIHKEMIFQFFLNTIGILVEFQINWDTRGVAEPFLNSPQLEHAFKLMWTLKSTFFSVRLSISAALETEIDLHIKNNSPKFEKKGK